MSYKFAENQIYDQVWKLVRVPITVKRYRASIGAKDAAQQGTGRRPRSAREEMLCVFPKSWSRGTAFVSLASHALCQQLAWAGQELESAWGGLGFVSGFRFSSGQPLPSGPTIESERVKAAGAESTTRLTRPTEPFCSLTFIPWG